MEIDNRGEIKTSITAAELYCEIAECQFYGNEYSKALAEKQFTEQITIDPIDNVFDKYDSTIRKHTGLFRNGFLRYKY